MSSVLDQAEPVESSPSNSKTGGAIFRAAMKSVNTVDAEDREATELRIDADGNFKLVPKVKFATVQQQQQQRGGRSRVARVSKEGAAAVKSTIGSALSAASALTGGGASRISSKWGVAAHDTPSPANKHPVRIFMRKLEQSSTFRVMVLMCVGSSTYQLATEYPADASKEMNYLYVEMAINALFSLEFIVKVIASGIRGYLKVGWNMLDFLVVVDGWLIVIIYYVGMTDRFTLSMRMLKMARLLRPLRFLSINPTLRGIMNGLFKSVNDLGSTLILIGFFMTVYGGVERHETRQRNALALIHVLPS